MPIEVSNVVQLKSGGPKMTVTAIVSEVATCFWFSHDQLTQGAFPVAALKKIGNGENQASEHKIE